MTVPASSASPSATGRFMAFPFELLLNLTSPHATKVARGRSALPTNQYCFGCPSRGLSGAGGWGFHLRDRPRNKTLTLRTVPVTICFSYELGRSREADAG